MKLHLFWRIQDSYNERARVGFWLEAKRWHFHFALRWYKSDEFRGDGANCFVFKKRKPLFKYAFSLMYCNLQMIMHYDEYPEKWPPGPTGPTGVTAMEGLRHATI